MNPPTCLLFKIEQIDFSNPKNGIKGPDICEEQLYCANGFTEEQLKSFSLKMKAFSDDIYNGLTHG
jgi:hypothetical protein